MALVTTLLASLQSATDTTSYATASVSPTADALVSVGVLALRSGAPPSTPTVTGNGGTYTLEQDQYVVDNGTQYHLYVFARQAASPSSGAVTVDFGAETQSGIRIVVQETTGVPSTAVIAQKP